MKLGSHLTKEHKDKLRQAHLGKKLSEETKIKMGLYKVENENHNWKGDSVGYRALHEWVYKKLGRPNKCSYCDKIGNGHQMHWANISGKYKRITDDWVRLCVKCHSNFDK